MKSIEAYQTVDGRLFESEQAAINHESDLIGCELDALFDLFKMKSGPMSIEHSRIFKACLSAIENKSELSKICNNIVNIIDRE